MKFVKTNTFLTFLFTILLSFPNYTFSQTNRTKQFNSRYLHQIDSLMKLGDKYQYEKPDSALFFYTKAQKVAHLCGCKEHLAHILNAKAIVLMDNGKLQSAYLLLDSAKNLITDSTYYYHVLNNLATIYSQLGFYQKAFKIHRKQLKYFKKLKDTQVIAVTYSNIAALYSDADNYDSAFFYAFKAFKLDKELKDTINVAFDYYNLGIYFTQVKKFDSAKLFLDSALLLAKKHNLKFWLANIYDAFGEVFENKGQTDSAMKYYFKGLNTAKLQNNFDDITRNFLMISKLCLKINNLECAKSYLDSSSILFHKYGNNFSISVHKDYLEAKYKLLQKLGEADSALAYYQRFVNLKDSLDAKKQLTVLQVLNLELKAQKAQKQVLLLEYKSSQRKKLLVIYSVTLVILIILLAVMTLLALRLRKMQKQLYKKNKQLEALLEKDRVQISLYKIQKLALEKAEKTTIEEFLTIFLEELFKLNCLNIEKRGAIFLKDEEGNLKMVAQKNLDVLVQYCKKVEPGQCLCGKAFEQNQKIICENLIKEHTSHILDEPHGHYVTPLGVSDEVLGVLNLYLPAGYKLNEQEKYFLDQVTIILSLILERKLNREKIEKIAKKQDELNQRLFAQSLLLEEEKQKLEKASKKIKRQAAELTKTLNTLQEGITYASYMLESLLPSLETFNELFKEYFLIFKPLEKIGGDFYFVSKVENKIYLAVGDGTGHSVPGAILAAQILGFLYEIIQQRKICEPSQILSSLREKIKVSYNHSDYDSIKRSGVDIGMCVIDPKTNTLGFAGANIPLYIVRNGQLIKLKPTKVPVGHYVIEKSFEQHLVSLQDGDMIYLQSDGFVDQLSKDYKKFARRRYEYLLLQISDLPAKEQKDIILKIFEQWKGNNNQTDDIIILGVRWDSEFYKNWNLADNKPNDEVAEK